MIFEHNDYRSFLKKVLVERIQNNPSYSLRAFASNIGISASMLSEVFKGEKKLSVEKGSLVSSRLNLTVDEEQYWLALVQLDGATDVKQRQKILLRVNELAPNRAIRDLSVDHFLSIADWVCATGIALLAGFPKGLSAKQIGQKLGITHFEASEAMDRWIRLDLVEKKSGIYTRLSSDHLMMSAKAPNGALRKFHRTMLEKAIDSLETQNNLEKFVGSETFAIDSAKLGEVSAIIEEATQKIIRIAKRSEKKKDVYHLGFQFFRITKKENRK